MEHDLLRRIYHHERFVDDLAFDGVWEVQKAISLTGWGLEGAREPSSTKRGAWKLAPVLNTRDDLERLQVPRVSHDEAETDRRIEAAEELFGDRLPVRVKGVAHISYHLMSQYTALRGVNAGGL